jgi:hypothetical protein
MNNFLDEFFRSHHVSVFIGFTVAAIVGVWVLLKSRFAAQTASWPTVSAEIENVFVDVSNRLKRVPITHAVVAYSYLVGGSYYSGQIRLVAGESSLEILVREMIGQRISIQYDSTRPEISIFRMNEVQGWDVEKDARLSVWTSIAKLLDKLP